MEQEFINAASVPGGTPEPRETGAEAGASDALRADEQSPPQDRDGTTAERGGHGRRRLFSLTSQLRRPPQSRQQIEARHEAEARQRAELGETPEPRSRAEQEQARHAAEEGGDRNGSGREAAPTAAAASNGNGASAATAGRSGEAAAPSAEAAPPVAAPAAPAPRRPSRPIYTLQQVHEMTGIPYPTLAFYAAAEASRIPSLGERHAPAYPFESLQAFCRLHAERTPGWEIPDLTPPDDEISLRLEALERGQQQLEAVLQAVLAELAEPLSGTST